jgi:hypothetical protein
MRHWGNVRARERARQYHPVATGFKLSDHGLVSEWVGGLPETGGRGQRDCGGGGSGVVIVVVVVVGGGGSGGPLPFYWLLP